MAHDPVKHRMVRVDKKLTDQLMILAKKRHRSLTAEINSLIEQEVKIAKSTNELTQEK